MRRNPAGREYGAELVTTSDRGSDTGPDRRVRNVCVEAAHSVIRRPHKDLSAVDLARVGLWTVRLELGDVRVEGSVHGCTLACPEVHAVLDIPVRPLVASLVVPAESFAETRRIDRSRNINVEGVH